MAGSQLDPMLGRLSQILDVRMQQHGLSTSNIANAQTPGYLARRLDFETTLDRILGDDGPVSLPDPFDQGGPVRGEVDVVDAPAWSEDGNSVNPEEEMTVMVSNNMLYNATVEVVSRRLALLKYAASDGGRG